MRQPPRPSSSPIGVLLDCTLYVVVAALVAHWLWAGWIVAWPLPAAVTHPLLILVLSLPAWALHRVYLNRVVADRGSLLLGGLRAGPPVPPPTLPTVGAIADCNGEFGAAPRQTDGRADGVHMAGLAGEGTRPLPYMAGHYELRGYGSGGFGARGWVRKRPGDALRRELRRGDLARLEGLLGQLLPPGLAVSDAMVTAATELALLMAAVREAQAARLAVGLTDLFESRAERAADALGKSLDRLAAASTQDLRSERVSDLLIREEEALKELAAVTGVLRESLARAVLEEGGELEEAQLELRALDEGVREVMDREGRRQP